MLELLEQLRANGLLIIQEGRSGKTEVYWHPQLLKIRQDARGTLVLPTDSEKEGGDVLNGRDSSDHRSGTG